MNLLENLHMPFSFSGVLWIFFILFMIFYLIVSAVLLYHWQTYGMRNRNIQFAKIVYIIVSAFLVIMSASTLILI